MKTNSDLPKDRVYKHIDPLQNPDDPLPRLDPNAEDRDDDHNEVEIESEDEGPEISEIADIPLDDCSSLACDEEGQVEKEGDEEDFGNEYDDNEEEGKGKKRGKIRKKKGRKKKTRLDEEDNEEDMMGTLDDEEYIEPYEMDKEDDDDEPEKPYWPYRSNAPKDPNAKDNPNAKKEKVNLDKKILGGDKYFWESIEPTKSYELPKIEKNKEGGPKIPIPEGEPDPEAYKKKFIEELTPIKAFNMFFPDEIYYMMYEQTFVYVNQQFEKGLITRKDIGYKYLTIQDMRNYVALVIWMCIVRVPQIKQRWVNHFLYQNPMGKVMSGKKWVNVNQILHLADNKNSNKKDPLYKLRPLMEILEHKFEELYDAAECVTVDEAMVKFTGQLFFKQYMKRKPVQWGIKLFLCCDSRNGYCHSFRVYTGKREHMVMFNNWEKNKKMVEELKIKYKPVEAKFLEEQAAIQRKQTDKMEKLREKERYRQLKAKKRELQRTNKKNYVPPDDRIRINEKKYERVIRQPVKIQKSDNFFIEMPMEGEEAFMEFPEHPNDIEVKMENIFDQVKREDDSPQYRKKSRKPKVRKIIEMKKSKIAVGRNERKKRRRKDDSDFEPSDDEFSDYESDKGRDRYDDDEYGRDDDDIRIEDLHTEVKSEWDETRLQNFDDYSQEDIYNDDDRYSRSDKSYSDEYKIKKNKPKTPAHDPRKDIEVKQEDSRMNVEPPKPTLVPINEPPKPQSPRKDTLTPVTISSNPTITSSIQFQTQGPRPSQIEITSQRPGSHTPRLAEISTQKTPQIKQEQFMAPMPKLEEKRVKMESFSDMFPQLQVFTPVTGNRSERFANDLVVPYHDIKAEDWNLLHSDVKSEARRWDDNLASLLAQERNISRFRGDSYQNSPAYDFKHDEWPTDPEWRVHGTWKLHPLPPTDPEYGQETEYPNYRPLDENLSHSSVSSTAKKKKKPEQQKEPEATQEVTEPPATQTGDMIQPSIIDMDVLKHKKNDPMFKSSEDSLTKFVVNTLIKKWEGRKYTIYMDNFYTSVSLFEDLLKRGIRCCGTIKANRVTGLPPFKTPDKGDFIFFRARSIPDMYLLLFHDSKPVWVITTQHLPIFTELKPNFDLKASAHSLRSKIPNVIDEYNHHTHGVDQCNCETSRYRYPHKCKKWWKSMFFYFLRLALFNSYVYYSTLKGGKKFSLLVYMEEIVKGVLPLDKVKQENSIGHFPRYIDPEFKTTVRCSKKGCDKRTMYYCTECSTINKKVYLCIPQCFNQFHTDKYLNKDKDKQQAKFMRGGFQAQQQADAGK